MTPGLLALVLAAASSAPSPFGSTATRASPRQPLVVMAARPEARRAALVVQFHAGAVDDGDLPGLTRVAQHALLESSRRLRYAELVQAVRGAAASLEFSTGLGDCTFWLEAGREDFGRLSAIMLELLLRPDLDPAAFPSARESAQHAEREGSGRDLIALIASKVVDDPAFGNSPTGTEAGVELIEWRDVARHLAGPLAPANATVVVAGGFDAASVRRTLARVSGGTARARTAPVLSTPFSLQVPARKEIYLLAYRAAFRTAEQVAVARLAAALAEERIEWFFRDRGVGYSASVELVHRPWLDLFAVTLPAHDRAGGPLAGLLEEQIAVIGEGRFTDEELERNRSWVLASMERSDDEPLELALTLAEGNGGAWFGPDVAQAVRRLDRQAFARGAAALLEESASIRILYSPRAAVRGAIPEAFRKRSSR